MNCLVHYYIQTLLNIFPNFIPPFHNIKQIPQISAHSYYTKENAKIHTQKGASMAEKKTYEPLDELLESTGMKYSAIAEKSNIDKSYLYRLRKKPSKLDGELILRISKATGIDKNKLFDISYFFATKVDKLQQKAS